MLFDKKQSAENIFLNQYLVNATCNFYHHLKVVTRLVKIKHLFISVSLELEDTEMQLSIFHILLLSSILSNNQGSNCYKQN